MLQIKTNLNNKLEIKEEVVFVAAGKLVVKKGSTEIHSIPVSEIDKAFVEEGLGIARLVIKPKAGKEIETAYFTKSQVKRFRKFTDAINQYIVKNLVIAANFDEKKTKNSGISTLYWLYGF